MLTNHNRLIDQPTNYGSRITFWGAGSRELATLGVRCRSKATVVAMGEKGVAALCAATTF